MSEENPYAAPQTVHSVFSGAGPESDLQLSPAFFSTAAGGKTCLNSIRIVLVSIVIGILISVINRKGPIGIIVMSIGLFIGTVLYFAGLNKLRQLPAETGARIAFSTAFVFFALWIVMYAVMTFWSITHNGQWHVLLQLVNEIIQIIITVATLYGQRCLANISMIPNCCRIIIMQQLVMDYSL